MKNPVLLLALFAPFLASAGEIDLKGSWILSGRDISNGHISCPIDIPGGVHSALLEAGVLPDVYYADNETQTLWVARRDWTISRSFEVPAGFLKAREIVLRLEDCDSFCTVKVNGRSVGRTTDRFQRYTFDVKPFLKAGENTISGFFESPVRVADERRAVIGKPYPMSNVLWSKNQALIRKPACHGGWDWGPELEVMGFCGTVKLIASDSPRIDYVYTTQRFNDDLTHCTLMVFADLSDGSSVTNVVEIDNPPLWWPNGAGERKFYEYAVPVNGEIVKGRIGLRKLEVLNEKTVSTNGQDDLSLVFRVNNRRLFMKGANWIPCDAYENRQTPEKYRGLLKSVADANMNMLRVWGGGQYEKDVFYDTCDELGILLWHDMMCSCAVYPGEGVVADEIRAELAHQLRRLRDHASIALWCGDNECLGAVNWFPETKDQSDFYRGEWVKRSKMQGEMVATYDPARAYWPSSPCCGPGDFGDGWKTDSKGDMHNWTVWHENKPFNEYYAYTPRFCSEFGYQSFPSFEVAKTFAPEEAILSRAGAFEWHQKNPGGNARIRETMARYFPPVKDVPAELLLSQFQHGMAMKMACDGWRAQRPRCMGTLFWQLNDNWPVASWSSIEYGGKWKPVQAMAKRFFEPVSVVAQPKIVDGKAEVTEGRIVALNDTAESLTGELLIEYWTYDGRIVASEKKSITLPPDSATTVGAFARPRISDLEAQTFLVLTLKTHRGIFQNDWHFDFYKNVPLASAHISISASASSLTLSTDKPAFFVWANAEGVRGEFDDNCFTLLPGRPKTIFFSGRRFEAFSVVSLSDLVKPAGCGHTERNVSRAEALRAKLDSNDRNYVFVVLHRGDWRHAPENSVGAIEGAIAMGGDIIELDAAPTKDGHYVLLHDDTLDRVSNGKGAAKDMTLAEIKQYRLKNDDGTLSDYEIMTLEEAFRLTKGRILVNIDKYSRDVKGITECAIRCGVAREIIFKARMKHNDLKRRLGPALWARFVSGELFYMPILDWNGYDAAEWQKWADSEMRASAYEMCFPQEPEGGNFAARLAMGPAGEARIWINTLWDSLCAGHTDERGFKGDTAGSWGWCLDRGATIIQTDRPKELIDYLKSIGRH